MKRTTVSLLSRDFRLVGYSEYIFRTSLKYFLFLIYLGTFKKHTGEYFSHESMALKYFQSNVTNKDQLKVILATSPKQPPTDTQ